MDRSLQQDEGAFEPGIVNLFLEWVSLAAGAVPTTVVRGSGFPAPATAWRTGTGAYTVPLSDSYTGLLGWSVVPMQAAAYSATGACYASAGATENVKAASPSISFVIRTAAGAAVDPLVGDRIKISVQVQRLAPANS